MSSETARLCRAYNKMADKRNVKSIAIEAISSGKLHFGGV